MNDAMQDGRFLGGLLTGVAATVVTWQFGATIVTSGWTTTACGTGLLASAAAVAATRWLDHGVDPRMRGVSGTLVCRRDVVPSKMSERPRDWLRSAGVETVPEPELAGFLRARLSGGLNVRSDAIPGKNGLDFPGPVMALAAALASMSSGSRQRKEGRGLLQSLARCHDVADAPSREAVLPGILLEARRIAMAPEIKEAFRDVSARHGMRETFMMGLLDAARLKGPIGSGEFPWLKELDRGLWYALSNLGRRSFHVEGLAAMDHYAHEWVAGARLTSPHVAKATDAMCGIALAMREAPGDAEMRGRAMDAAIWDDEADESDDGLVDLGKAIFTDIDDEDRP